MNRKYKYNDKNVHFMSLPFISDKFNKKANCIIKKTGLPICLAISPGLRLTSLTKKTAPLKCVKSCLACDSLPRGINCHINCMVYSFRCKICGEEYVGETCRWFIDRWNEHSRSIEKGDTKSALSEHLMTAHKSAEKSIKQFKLKVLNHCKDPLETAITEALYIQQRKPHLNRKHELVEFQIIA